MAPTPTESSPLLSPNRAQGGGRSPANDPSAARQQRAQWLTRRALYIALPLAALALVALGWLFAGPSISGSDDSTDATTGTAPRLRDGERYSDAELLTLLPPFVARKHPLPPKIIDAAAVGAAIPTNAFWTNLLVGDDHGLNAGGGEVTLSPYTVRSLPRRLDVSYGDTRRVVTSGNITEFFHADVSLTAYSRVASSSSSSHPQQPQLLGEGNSTSRSIGPFDPLSVALRYHFENETAADATHWLSALLVRGSPFLTLEYTQLVPVIELNSTLRAINGQRIRLNESELQTFTATRFELEVDVYGAMHGLAVPQTWVVYFATERTLTLQNANETDVRPYNMRGELTTPTTVRLVDSARYTGAMRLAVVPSAAARALLDASANVYPVGAVVNHSVDALEAVVTFNWTTKTMMSDLEDATASQLLMLAHPHQTATLVANTSIVGALGHRTVKSNMTAVRGNVWTMVEPLPDVGFDAQHAVKQPAHVAAIQAALVADANYTPSADDPYFFGKEIARQARLVLIADVMNDTSTRDAVLEDLERWLVPWLVGSNDNHFVYDSAWGGLCSKNGLKGVFFMTDFGNGWYNDHHFHYGYLLYSIAVVAKFRPAFGETHRASILAITRDIASVDPNDTYFPFTRHFSWFDGHSFASGVYTLDGGKSQESVSEAINAYYGVLLLGKALALPAIEHIGHVLLAMEIRAAQTYWQMPLGTPIYEPVYAQNKMTGQIAATKVSYTTWFGPQVEHMHLINMIPFTPVTDAFITRAYVQEEYPVLQTQAFERPIDPIDARWRGYAFLDLAIIDAAAAWPLVRSLEFFDDGSSLTNALYWIATRPPQKEKSEKNETAPAGNVTAVVRMRATTQAVVVGDV